ncbi:MAG TPA: hypothetical protein VHZ50_08465, partial [Puia sp.]|nr:hypothetical protein [Puia sp.]
MNIVENFMENEKAKVNWLHKLFQTYPVFYFAKDIQKEIKRDVVKRNYIVRPSKLIRAIAFLFICFGLFFWLTLLNMIFENILLPITVIFLLLVTCWISSILWIFFLNPKYSYKITLNNSEIIIGKEL